MGEKIKRAVAALREPHAPFVRVPNTVRQSLADLIEQQQARISELEAELATQIQIGVTDAEEMDRLAGRAEAAESEVEQLRQELKDAIQDQRAGDTDVAQAEAREADSRHCFKRIIQVRAGDGMLQGKEALDEMARLAGEALSRLDQPENG